MYPLLNKTIRGKLMRKPGRAAGASPAFPDLSDKDDETRGPYIECHKADLILSQYDKEICVRYIQ